MAFLDRAFPPLPIPIQCPPENNALMRLRARESILFLLPQRVVYFVFGLKLQYLLEGTLFDLVLSLLVIWRLEELDRAGNGCLCWYDNVIRTGVVRGVSVYWRRGSEFPKLNSI